MAISSFSATAGASSMLLPQGQLEVSKGLLVKHPNGLEKCGRVLSCLNQKQQLNKLHLLPLSLSYKPLLAHIACARSKSLICSAALNARCGAEGQTQTLEKPTSVIQNAPGKEKSPQLDDGGTGLPPRDDDGGGGGGGGGGGNFSGGFFFFGFLAFLGFLKDKESEGDYRDSRR
ncbi:hypothetical protein KSS87_012170 [Heliosperma pusillum]|nr:hypothetical protein KSS87_012170 [Heliosperma pusillum]